MGDLEEIRDKDWVGEYQKRKRSLQVQWTNQYSDVQLADLNVIDILGKGSFGTVYLVESPLLPGLSFALKKIKKNEVTKGGHQTYVFNEKRIMQICNSPFICK